MLLTYLRTYKQSYALFIPYNFCNGSKVNEESFNKYVTYYPTIVHIKFVY